MRLLLVRHGQIPSNVLGKLDTAKPGPSLTALGVKQAAAVPGALADHGIGAIFASTLIRTQETAAPLCEALGLALQIDENLREIQAGSLEGRTDREAQLVYVSTALAWASGDLGRRMPDGADGHDFFARFDSAIDRVVSGGAAVAAVFSHGMAIRTWASSRAANIDGVYGASHELENTGMVALDNSGGSAEWRMLEWHSAPIGGKVLADPGAVDPTGETVLRGRADPSDG